MSRGDRRGTLGAMGILVGMVAGVVAGIIVRKSAARLAGRAPVTGACETACSAWGIVAVTGATTPTVVALALLGWWSVCLATVDALVRRLPNVLTVGGGVAVLAVAGVAGHGRAALAGAALLTVPLLVTHLVSPRSLGAGDVKLAVALGAATGVAGTHAWLLAALLPPVFTAVVALVLVLSQSRKRRAAAPRLVVPHGPSMCAAAMLALVAAG